MAFFFRTSTSNLWFFSLKISLISIGAFTVALVLKLSVPAISQFLLSYVPVLCASLRSCLTPPYLYVVINGIIIIIAASSRFQQKADDDHGDHHYLHRTDPPEKPGAGVAEEDFDADFSLKNKTELPRSPVFEIGDLEDCNVDVSMTKNKKTRKKKKSEELLEDQAARESKEDDVIVRERTTMSRTDSTEILPEHSLFSPEKPLVSSRFSRRRSHITPDPEGGKSLRVAKTKKQDTLESTWKKITEGRSMPLARHLKKSDTWETTVHHRPGQKAPDEEGPHSMTLKKAEMFNEANTNKPTSSLKRSSGKIKKDPSLSQEELNRRVEAFIRSFNEEMMLQRQESLNRYLEMVNSGAASSTDYQ